MSRETNDWKQLNGLALAYIGDAVYEVFIREHLLKSGKTKPNELHKSATSFVSANAQYRLIQRMKDEKILTSAEEEVFKRGRNAKSHTTAKNANIAAYRASTGFEALIGFLHLTGQHDRLSELVDWCIREVESGMDE